MRDDLDRLEDAELLAAFRDGRIEAFVQLVERHQRSLINFFYHLLWDRQASEDCAQDVFLRLYTHAGTYEPQAKFTTFLYRIARNLWIDRVRSGKTHARVVSLETPAGPGEEKTLTDRVPAHTPTPVEILGRRETQEAVRGVIALLPEEHRIVILLSEIQGMKYREIGEILGVPVGTVKSRMHAAIEKLKELMADRNLS